MCELILANYHMEFSKQFIIYVSIFILILCIFPKDVLNGFLKVVKI